MDALFFWIFAGMAVVGGVLTITLKNTLYSALALVGSFVALAGLYFLLDSSFPAILQIILYAGAIMVLVVFVIMFLNVPDPERLKNEISKPGLAAAVFLLVPLAAVMIGIVWTTDLVLPGKGGGGHSTAAHHAGASAEPGSDGHGPGHASDGHQHKAQAHQGHHGHAQAEGADHGAEGHHADEHGGHAPVAVAFPPVEKEFGTVQSAGNELFKRWIYPFEVLSLLILAAMVGAVLIAKRKLD